MDGNYDRVIYSSKQIELNDKHGTMGCDSYEIAVILLGIGATYQYACNTLGTTIRILENMVGGENHKLFVVDSYCLVTGAPCFSACK